MVAEKRDVGRGRKRCSELEQLALWKKRGGKRRGAGRPPNPARTAPPAGTSTTWLARSSAALVAFAVTVALPARSGSELRRASTDQSRLLSSTLPAQMDVPTFSTVKKNFRSAAPSDRITCW
jgi:hypothetical protein